ncbi:MAG TPA: tyrosine--tRNA ligase [Nitrospinota bacterium]|nr:tyrosine--tRNA ligase [Nitrospinota bacterium]
MNLKEQLRIIEKGTVEIINKEELIKKAKESQESKRPLNIKAGFDPTSPDIHLGHTLLLSKLKQFQQLGHNVIFLIGDFTAMIGDPSGKNETRPVLTKDEIIKNSKTYQNQIFKILDPQETKIVYNSDWMEEMSAEFLIKLCATYTVARMLERDDFLKRYKEQRPITIHEFLYPLIQGYDSVKLKADIEIGGTDQKFNLLVAREIQRTYGLEPQVIITLPILVGIDGKQKMSKSLGNYIGIDESPKEIFGKIMSINDQLMMTYYETISELTDDEIEKIRKDIEKNRLNPKQAKIKLAKEIVERFYNKELAEKAEEEFNKIFTQKDFPENAPKTTWPYQEEEKKLTIILKENDYVDVGSSSEAVRLIKQGAITVNEQKISDIDYKLNSNEEYRIKVGKRQFLKIFPRKYK